jgi:uncharacterized protein (TIGR01777 family)
MNQKIIIAGGTGFLGRSLIEFFSGKQGYALVVLTRTRAAPAANVTYIEWDATTPGNWTAALEGSLAIINLVGRSVNCRYTERNQQEIINSRVNATLAIGRAIQQAVEPPKVWINAGSAAIYGDGKEDVKTEQSETGQGFSADVCKKWEQAFDRVATPFTKKVFLRIGLVFQKDRGLLLPFVNLVNLGLGGRIGSGRQYISWIHERDFIQVVYETIVNEDIRGVINVSSPEPVSNENFMRALRKGLGVGVGLPNPSFLTRIGALFIGTEAILVLTGRRVIPGRLQQLNFTFKYPGIDAALKDLLNKGEQTAKRRYGQNRV